MSPRDFVDRAVARGLDFAMCAAMTALQSRQRLHANSRAELERYIEQCEAMTLEDFYAAPPCQPEWSEVENSRGDVFQKSTRIFALRWPSPINSGFAANDRTHLELFQSAAGLAAPTIFLLHALMSSSDAGYHEWARKFNVRGWNACFVHLPFHYSRTPRGHFNGELAISADLVRTAQGLRQGVAELRQAMRFLRGRGGREFALWASSYGGWIGALLSFVERDFRFLALMEPIVNIEHAIWRCAAGRWLRLQLRRRGIPPELVARHFHLTSPMHHEPLCGGARVIFAAGDYDQIAPRAELEALHGKWRGSELFSVAQGHFGYRMMPAMFARLVARGLI